MKTMAFGKLEEEVMEVVWAKTECTVRDVLIELQEHKKLAYTTIATILHRLDEKGLVKKKSSASGYVYMPNISKGAYTRNVANSFLKTFIGSFGDDAIASFADSVDKLPEGKKGFFLKLLEKNDKNK